jgi:hypothetical protein
LLAAAGTALALSVIAHNFNIDAEPAAALARAPEPAAPEAVAPELVSVVSGARGRVRESQQYHIDPAQQEEFLSVMAEVRNVRGRCGAVSWQLFEDVAHPGGWLEVWSVENWIDHLREASRLSGADRNMLARALAFHQGDPVPPSRHLAVLPHRLTAAKPGAPRPAA